MKKDSFIAVSVIVPVYNVSRYLNRCVDSLVGQTLRNIEVILVDDGSIDGSPEICDEYVERFANISVIHKVNAGLGYARNSGLDIARGEYVAFIDSDDWLDPQMMEVLYKECKACDADVIYSEFNVDDYPGFRVILHPRALYEGYDEIERLRLDIVGAEPSYPSSVRFQCSACKGLYRKRIIDVENIRFLSEREYISEDLLFNLSFLIKAERVLTVPYQFYHYCLNNVSLTHSYRHDRWQKQLLMLKALDNPADYHDEQDLKLRIARTAMLFSMVACRQEKGRDDIPVRCKISNIRSIISEKYVTDLLKGYPFHRLPLKWFVYYLIIKCKSASMIYFFI